MSNVTNKLFVDKMGGRSAEQYVGVQGELFYDPADGRLRLSDGQTAGGTLVNTPTNAIPYRGFYAAYGSFFDSDPSVNQIIISKNAGMRVTYDTEDTNLDDLHATGLSGSDVVVVLNAYGNSNTEGLSAPEVARFVKAFIDDVVINNQNNIEDLRNAFYSNITNLVDTYLPNKLDTNFEFFNSANWNTFTQLSSSTSTSPATVFFYADSNNNNQYVIDSLSERGTGFEVGQTIGVLGETIGLITVANDAVFTVDSIGPNGEIMGISVTGTGIAGAWTNYIDDGGDDQYDSGNYLNTNHAQEISYGNGIEKFNSPAIGGGDYVVTYQNGVFAMMMTNANISEFYFSGEMGADGSGNKVESALFGHESVQNTETVDSFGNLIVADSSEMTVNVGPGETHQVPNMSGLILVNDHWDGGIEMWLVGSGNGTEVLVSSTKPQTGTVQADYSVNGYSWTNTSNLNGPFTFTVVKTRNGA